jgi:hypothetical protein
MGLATPLITRSRQREFRPGVRFRDNSQLWIDPDRAAKIRIVQDSSAAPPNGFF